MVPRCYKRHHAAAGVLSKRAYSVIISRYIDKKIGKASDKNFELLLAHTPTFAKTYADWGADLVLSGHFHGGTIRIPGLGGVMTPQLQFFSPLARGNVTQKNTNIIVSGGLGTHSINVRLNNLPQLVVLTWKLIEFHCIVCYTDVV